jgi:hypothetical protein
MRGFRLGFTVVAALEDDATEAVDMPVDMEATGVVAAKPAVKRKLVLHCIMQDHLPL